MTVTPTDKILLLGEQQHERVYHRVTEVVETKSGEKKKVTRRVGKEIQYQVVVRLLPSGAFDPGFSRIGSAKFVDPANGSFSDLTGNAGDRTYLVGNLGKRVSPSPHNQILRRTFVLGRSPRRATTTAASAIAGR